MDNFYRNRPESMPNALLGKPAGSNLARWLIGILIAFLAFVVFAGLYSINQYNDIQRNDERVDAMWSHVLNQYSRRADLIPNVVTVVKAYAAHESALFSEIAEARARLSAITKSSQNARNPQSLEQFQQAQKQLSMPLARLLAVAENYPDLKASALFQDLMVQLEGTENRIAYTRQEYIAAVAEYNYSIRRFPNNLISAAAGYQPRARFTVEDESAVSRAPKVEMK